MKTNITLATLICLAFNTFASNPDSLNYKLDLDIKKYNLNIHQKSPYYAYKIMNGTKVQGRLFEYRDSSYTINIYYYYDIGVTRIDAVINGDAVLVRTNTRLTINNIKTRFKMHYTLFNDKGVIDSQSIKKKK